MSFLGIGGGLGNMFGLGSVHDPQHDIWSALNSNAIAAQQESKLGYAQAAATQRRALPIVRQAYQKQGQNERFLADQSKRYLGQNVDSALGAGAQQLGARGQGTSNLGGLVGRGIRGDLSRALQGIDQMWSQRFGQLGTEEAGAESGILGQIAGLQAGGTNAQTGITKSLMGGLGQLDLTPHQSNASGLGQFAKLGSSAASLFAGF